MRVTTTQLPEDVKKAEQALRMAVDDIRDAHGRACSEHPVAAMVLFQLRELAMHVKEG